MLYRRFGRTELQMPVLSCGGMRYQYKWQHMPMSEIPADSQFNLEATIRRAVEVGITHIETARGYGSSEIQLGQILPKLPREQMIIQTKISPKGGRNFIRKRKQFRQEFEESLQRLGLDYIDLFGIHGVNTAELLDDTLSWGGALEVAKQLQKEGKIRFIGFSTHAPTDVIIRAIQTNQFDYVNLHWYYINQANWAAIAAAKQQDMGVFIISPCNKGGLLDKPSQRLVELCQPLSPIVFNDLFCLSRPEVHTISIGASKPSDFDEHLKVLDYLDRADEILPPIIERLENEAIARLGEEWYKTWQVGLPSFDQTPGKLNIPVILWLRNLVLAYDMVEYGKMRYNLLGNGGHWFPGTKAEKVDAEQLRPLLKNSPHADLIPQFLQETHALLGGEGVQRLSQSE